MIEALDASTLDNTWVVYTSDHGEMMGAHRLVSKGAAMYDDITRVPLILRPPKGQREHRDIDTPVSHIDLLPTLLRLAGATPPPILPGGDLLSVDDQRERGVMVEFHRFEIEHDSFGGFIPVRAWIEDNYKLVINLLSGDELYHRHTDPEELTNLIDDPAHGEARDRLLAYMDEIRDPFRSYQWWLRPWREDARAKWLGAFRPRPEDGVSPVVRDYDTGLPTRGVKVEKKTQEF